LESTNARTRLLNLNGVKIETFSDSLKNYLKAGEEKDINNRYKCKKRGRWYDVPIIKNGSVCFFKRFHRLPRVIVNGAGVHTTDIAYNIRFKENYDPQSFAFCFYNSLTLALCESNGSFYGGGVGELVPNEFKALSIPYMKIDDTRACRLDELFRSGASISQIVDFVDSVVLCDLPSESRILLREIRNRYLVRRMKLYEREEKSDGE